MKKIIEHLDGFRWHDGNTSSAPFEKDSDLWNELIEEGCEVEYLSQAEKDAYAAQEARNAFKTQRIINVQNITVEISTGKVFDGNEQAQERMNRAITVANETGILETEWVLADNTKVLVTKAELVEALALSGQKQTELWTE